jgi:hypothetical protein
MVGAARVSLGWKGGSTTRWRKLREQVLLANVAATGGRCQLAYPGDWPVVVRDPGGGSHVEVRRCLGTADTVHHTLGKGVTGDDPRYLQAVCGPCNRKAGEPLSGPDPAVTPVTTW